MSLERDYGLFSPDLIRNSSDHAVYLWERLRTAGTTAEIEEYERMLERVEPGTKHFDGFTEDVFVLDSQLFICREGNVGMREFGARIHLLGDHYKNGIGVRLPWEQAGNSLGEDESVTYGIVRSHHTRPGRTTATLPPVGSSLYQELDQRYKDFQKKLTGFDTVRYVLWQVGDLRASRPEPIQFERSNTIFDASALTSGAAD